jgi:predicted RNase H-like nuclease (RuvC/YqgF family)
MNFYSMDVYEIERHLIAGKPYNSDDVIDSLIEKLKEVSYKYGQLTEVLERWDYWTDPIYLEDELELREDQLNDLKENVENLKHENSTLQDEINVLKETFANS